MHLLTWGSHFSEDSIIYQLDTNITQGRGGTESKLILLMLEVKEQWAASWCLLTRDTQLPSQAHFNCL